MTNVIKFPDISVSEAEIIMEQGILEAINSNGLVMSSEKKIEIVEYGIEIWKSFRDIQKNSDLSVDVSGKEVDLDKLTEELKSGVQALLSERDEFIKKLIGQLIKAKIRES